MATNVPSSGPETARQREAVRLLGHLPLEEARLGLLGALVPGTAADVQRAAIEALLRGDDAGGREAVLSRWSSLAPETRLAVLDWFLRRPSGPTQVLDAVAARRIAPRELSAAQLTALRTHADAGIRQRAIEALGAPAASRHDAVAMALPALDLRGDAAQGRLVHQVQCAPCHRLEGQGYALGPDLESVRSQPKEKLLVAIVDPNREVQPAYLASTVEATDDEFYTGLIVADTAAGITIRQAGGVETQIPRGKTREVRAEGRSIMPEGFETTLSAQQLADLLAALTGQP
jgi:putative heme-binding domain-containing protein